MSERPFRLLLSAIGSLGDLHPTLAVARAARDMGAEVTMAVAADHVDKVTRAGLAAVAILPGVADLCRARGIDEADFTRLTMQDPGAVLREMLVPQLADSVSRLGPAARGHELIAANFLSLAAPIVAEVLRLPLVPLVMQPPQGAGAGAGPGPGAGLARQIMQAALRRQYGPAIDLVRASVGLGPQISVPVYEADGDVPFRLGLYPPLLAGPPEADPPGLRMVGFARHDEAGGDAALDPELEAFLHAGPPPLVVTLGTSAPHIGLGFFSESVAAARMLGLRSVLLPGKGWQGPRRDADFIVCDYAPFAKVFPRAAAIIHHAGMGTIGLALAAGRPQLMVPVLFDQPGNAALAQARGLGLVLPFAQFTAAGAAEALRRLMMPQAVARLRRAGDDLAAMDGARAAAAALIELARARRAARQAG